MKLDIGSEERFETSIDMLWAGLNDPEALKRCIPGCKIFHYGFVRAAKIALKRGSQ
jgi:carbon monoxide dehydrogenase subunit G